MKQLLFITAWLAGTLWLGSEPPSGTVSTGMVRIPEGLYRPQFRIPAEPSRVRVNSFAMEIRPVTHGEFLDFVRANPEWRRSRVPRLFADSLYLQEWASDLDLGSRAAELRDLPVTSVSWFAARAYARWKGRRLPTVAEWEYVASASPTRPDGENDPAFQAGILKAYSRPSREWDSAAAEKPNWHGVKGLHAGHWEWVDDFNSVMLSGDSRDSSGDAFCGGGAAGAVNPANYAAFMRQALRTSLRPSYSVANLGFRCVSDGLAVTPPARDNTPAPHSGNSLYNLAASWTNDSGARAALDAGPGKPVVIALFYTQCGGSCPLLMHELKSLEEKMEPAERARIRFVLVSIDPERDTAAVLHQHRTQWALGEEWTLLNGHPEAVRELAAVLGVKYKQTAPGQIAHSSVVTLLDANGDISRQWPAGKIDPEDWRSAIGKVLDAPFLSLDSKLKAR